MNRVIVRYRVKPERAAENERLIAAVFAELRERRPPGLRYASFKAADGVSFTHVASIESGDGKNPLSEMASFRAFTATIGERCDEPPVATQVSLLGAYRLLED